MITKEVTFKLNGREMTDNIPLDWNLLHYLRNGLLLTGTKCSCEEGECGACTVIMDGKAVTSCLVMAADIEGREIVTIEGLAPNKDEFHPLQTAFVAAGAIQCGFCTPGMIMSAKALLDVNPYPSEEEIRHALVGNLCRCTGYEKIVDAVQAAARGVTWTVDDEVWEIVEHCDDHGCPT